MEIIVGAVCGVIGLTLGAFGGYATAWMFGNAAINRIDKERYAQLEKKDRQHQAVLVECDERVSNALVLEKQQRRLLLFAVHPLMDYLHDNSDVDMSSIRAWLHDPCDQEDVKAEAFEVVVDHLLAELRMASTESDIVRSDERTRHKDYALLLDGWLTWAAREFEGTERAKQLPGGVTPSGSRSYAQMAHADGYKTEAQAVLTLYKDHCVERMDALKVLTKAVHEHLTSRLQEVGNVSSSLRQASSLRSALELARLINVDDEELEQLLRSYIKPEGIIASVRAIVQQDAGSGYERLLAHYVMSGDDAPAENGDKPVGSHNV